MVAGTEAGHARNVIGHYLWRAVCAIKALATSIFTRLSQWLALYHNNNTKSTQKRTLEHCKPCPLYFARIPRLGRPMANE